MNWIAHVNGKALDLQPEKVLDDVSAVEVEPGVYSVLLGSGRSIEVRVSPAAATAGWNVEIGGRTLTVEIRDPRERANAGAGGNLAGKQKVLAPMPGKVVRVLVAEGDTVEAGQEVIVVEAMKMQNKMKSPKAGAVIEVRTEAGATVAVGETLLVIE